MQSASKNVLLGISGGIAAYKTPELVRRLRDRGAEVQVVLTRSAREFVTETSLQAVSGRPIRSNIWDKEAEAAMGHIELARWADTVLIAPATAEMLSRLASGSAPDLLTTVCLATEAELVVAPAMNRVMWAKPAVQANCALLEQRGTRILGPGVGSQACGEEGAGRMLEPDEIARQVMARGPVSLASGARPLLAGKTVMVTAGPTREAIDPVRYITNRSSGKMGYHLAMAARDAGARVILISGPVSLERPGGMDVIEIESAEQLFDAAHKNIGGVDIFIAVAAVADYQPKQCQASKIKKTESGISIELVAAPDTLTAISALSERPFCVGFAAETEKVGEYARAKLARKKLDMIIANKVGANLGFDRDENSVEVFWRTGSKKFPATSKATLAVELVELISEHYEDSANNPAAVAASE
jgi:phosphopantothenoylcysteine decarboxylase / phosphopantothenate---cysteine ligase